MVDILTGLMGFRGIVNILLGISLICLSCIFTYKGVVKNYDKFVIFTLVLMQLTGAYYIIVGALSVIYNLW